MISLPSNCTDAVVGFSESTFFPSVCHSALDVGVPIGMLILVGMLNDLTCPINPPCVRALEITSFNVCSGNTADELLDDEKLSALCSASC